MTPTDLRAWRTHMGYTQPAAADALGMTVSNYKDLETGVRRSTGKPIDQLDKRTALACAAIAAGLG
jgi:transcriptional regulator with XRE-family HTH domain